LVQRPQQAVRSLEPADFVDDDGLIRRGRHERDPKRRRAVGKTEYRTYAGRWYIEGHWLSGSAAGMLDDQSARTLAPHQQGSRSHERGRIRDGNGDAGRGAPRADVKAPIVQSDDNRFAASGCCLGRARGLEGRDRNRRRNPGIDILEHRARQISGKRDGGQERKEQ
jgi:hypothetical protein